MNYKSVFIVGIKGVAMVHIATMLKAMGVRVQGVDVGDTYITDHLLTAAGITVHTRFDIVLPAEVDLLIYSASHEGAHNPLVQQAQKKGIGVVSQAAFLGELMQQFTNRLAVCGCHGKTTTSSLLAYTMLRMNLHPSYLIGSSGFNGYDGGSYDGKEWFVIEADEYGVHPPHDITPKFHLLEPTAILCTNIDFDHPDVYRDLAHVKSAYRTFLKKAQTVVICGDDPTLASYARKQPHMKTYGYMPHNAYRIVNYETTKEGIRFDLLFDEQVHESFETNLYGEKNILNAAGVVALLLQHGFSADAIRSGMSGFSGPKRRMEVLAASDDLVVIDDYAHHPDEIRAVIQALRARYDQRRLVVLFQPHTFSRTQALLSEFAHALSAADLAYIAPIFPSAREDSSRFNVTSYDIEANARSLGQEHVVAFASSDALLEHVYAQIAKGDVVCTMGAGDIYRMADGIMQHAIQA